MPMGEAELAWAIAAKQTSDCMLNFTSIFIIRCKLIPTTEQPWKCEITQTAEGGSGWNAALVAGQEVLAET